MIVFLSEIEFFDCNLLCCAFSEIFSLQSASAFSKILDTLKSEVPELDGLGYLEDISGSLGNLLSSPLKDIKCVESIVFSSFNPPPSYRR